MIAAEAYLSCTQLRKRVFCVSKTVIKHNAVCLQTLPLLPHLTGLSVLSLVLCQLCFRHIPEAQPAVSPGMSLPLQCESRGALWRVICKGPEIRVIVYCRSAGFRYDACQTSSCTWRHATSKATRQARKPDSMPKFSFQLAASMLPVRAPLPSLQQAFKRVLHVMEDSFTHADRAQLF